MDPSPRKLDAANPIVKVLRDDVWVRAHDAAPELEFECGSVRLSIEDGEKSRHTTCRAIRGWLMSIWQLVADDLQITYEVSARSNSITTTWRPDYWSAPLPPRARSRPAVTNPPPHC